VAGFERDRFVELIILQQINCLTMRPEQIKSKLNIQKKTIAIMVKQAEISNGQQPFVKGNDIRFIPSFVEVCTTTSPKPTTKGGIAF
jgi:hypothetical protein